MEREREREREYWTKNDRKSSDYFPLLLVPCLKQKVIFSKLKFTEIPKEKENFLFFDFIS